MSVLIFQILRLPGRIGNHVSAKGAPIDETLEAAGVNLGDYNAGAVSRNCTLDGHVFCLGAFTAGYNIFYNKDLFDAAGIPYPSPTEPMTIDEYAAIAMQLSVPSDDLAERVWGATLPPWWMDPANNCNEDGRSVLGFVNDENTIYFYQVAADLHASGSVLTGADLSLAGGSTADLLAAGQLAMSTEDPRLPSRC